MDVRAFRREMRLRKWRGVWYSVKEFTITAFYVLIGSAVAYVFIVGYMLTFSD